MNRYPSTETNPTHKMGFVGLAGAPNVGKSTLVNRLVGQKISIVSDRPQTTRERLCGIRSDATMQMALVDIPGILEPRDAFNTALMETAAQSLKDCDIILHLRDARRPGDPADPPVRAMIRRTKRPVWLVWNKIDRVPGKMFPAEGEGLDYVKVLGISAKTGRGVGALVDALREALPVGPPLFDEDQLSDRDLRFLAAEMVREKLFRYLGEEIPYALATFTDIFDEDRGEKIYIGITILTEREAHKPIIIGKGGAMLKKIGQAARAEIENLCQRPVYLDLRVKVHPRWRKDIQQLLELGLKPSISS
ncbi:MAG: GTPase Era [bacterium]|nr:GTPase Era [bacterium]